MRLYKLRKGEIGAIIFVFLSFCAWIFLIGSCGPPVTRTYLVNASNVALIHPQNAASTGCGIGPYAIRTETATRFNKKFWLYAVFRTENADEESYDVSFDYLVQMFGMVGSHHEQIGVMMYPRPKRRLSCVNKTCDAVPLVRVSHILYPRYEIHVGFAGLTHFHSKYRIKDIDFYIRTYTEEHSYMQLSFACIFMTATLFVLIWYQKSLKAYDMDDWSYEQRWTYLLLVSMFFFNGPLFASTFVTSGWVADLLLAISQITFVANLLGFWICLYHALRCCVRISELFYLPKITLVGLIWSFEICYAYYKTAIEGSDPTFFVNVDIINLESFERGLNICLAAYTLLLAYYGIRAYLKLHHLPHLNRRLNFATVMMGMITSLAIALRLVNIHGINIMQDELVGDLNLSFSKFTGTTTLFGFLNFYIYVLAFVYSPPPATQISGEEILKDNPALSMMNDSEESVVFTAKKRKTKKRQSGIAKEDE